VKEIAVVDVFLLLGDPTATPHAFALSLVQATHRRRLLGSDGQKHSRGGTAVAVAAGPDHSRVFAGKPDEIFRDGLNRQERRFKGKRQARVADGTSRS
jgi:hypothetical protein